MSGPLLFVEATPDVSDRHGHYAIDVVSGTETMCFVFTSKAANLLAHRINAAVNERSARERDSIVEFKPPASRRKRNGKAS
ncbi:hypothetical protein [uncultured Sphingomonas sp.]|uniref:hypothetical protein n=1 Tax=uncultured Sphingomonas sp. TaxID=158754 RepID=UPI0035CBFD3F